MVLSATVSGENLISHVLAFGPFAYSRILVLALVVHATNPDIGQRFKTMWSGGERLGILELLVEWVVVAATLLVVLVHPVLIFRLGWGVVIAGSTALGWLFHRLTGSQLTAFDMLALFEVKSWTADVSLPMKRQFFFAAILFAFVFLIFATPPGIPITWTMGSIDRYHLAWLPVVCVFFIIVENVAKSGVTLSPMPAQFNLFALLILNGFRRIFVSVPLRRQVDWVPEARTKKQNIIVLVDESVRGDYVSTKKGNTLTPGLASFSDKFVCFGPALSGGNCSSYSNVILRYGAGQERIVEMAQTNPSLFAYARKAGYRTVYIDAQTGYQAKATGLQNFMTMSERLEIDGFYVIQSAAGKKPADFQLADIVAAELKSEKPVFIYANKLGVHYPYESRYPKTEALYETRERNEAARSEASIISAYRNAINFAVEKFMIYLFARADLSNTTLIYTSDHGQWFSPNHFPHGMVHNPDPRTGIVPLWAYSSDKATVAAFKEGAAKSEGRASHFLIAPTLYELMGYSRADIAVSYQNSMFTGTTKSPRMTTGDIFGFPRFLCNVLGYRFAA